MSILTRYRKQPVLTDAAASDRPTELGRDEEVPPALTPELTDFECSVDTLYQGFILWHRLQRDGVVRKKTRDDVLQQSDAWQHRYPDTFMIMHKGSRCPESFVIGTGKYSTVYQRQNLAFKVIRVGHDRSPEHLSVLRCNIKELGYFHSLIHPNIMRCLQSQLVMEHGSLRRIIHQMNSARCNLQHIIEAHEVTCFQDLVYTFEGIARGLQYLHRLHIVHGDVKPSNVLLSPQYRPLLSDFTLTTAEGKGNEVAFGTLFWRSPECLLMQGCQRASDVWSFGIMLLDCLYGCTYMLSIMNAKDDWDLLIKLACVIDRPSDDWIRANVPEPSDDASVMPLERREQLRRLHHGLRYPDALWCAHVSERNQLQVTLQPREMELVQDLLSKVLCWDPAERLTMDQVLQHPMFTHLKAITPLPQVVSPLKTKLGPLKVPPTTPAPDPLDHPVHLVTWRDPSEREFIRRWARFYYMEHFHHSLPPNEDWLLQDVTILAKRLIDHLRVIECTFNTKNIIKVCSEFLYFLWKDLSYAQLLTANPLFESQMYHVLNLLQFNVFPFNVQERFVHDEPSPSVVGGAVAEVNPPPSE